MNEEKRYPYLHLDVDPEDVDENSARLFEHGAEGVEERDDRTLLAGSAPGRVTLVASFSTREEAEAAIAEIPGARYEEVVGDAWRDAWKEHFRPFAIAEGLVVCPPWETYEAKPNETVLELEPGRAFGTGLHETTRLVAGAIRRHAKRLENATVLDVGCGSGILALVALVSGAKHAIAVDIDPDAVLVTEENATRNGLKDRVEASTKSLAECAPSPFVLANIEAKTLIPMAEALAAVVAAGGILFLSGILTTQKDAVRAAYGAMDLVEAPELGEWALLALAKKS